MPNKTILQLTDGTAIPLTSADLLEVWNSALARSEKKSIQQFLALIGINSVFSDVAGASPPTAPLIRGTTAFSENTNEMWFVSSSLSWQQIIAI